MAISRRSSFQTAAITMQMAKADSADFGFQLKMRMACKKTEIGNGKMMKENRIEAVCSIVCSSCHKTMPHDQ